MKLNKWAVAGVVIAGYYATVALAHHSGTMFDNTKEVEVVGTVHEFQWTNPHVFIELMVAGPKGPYKYIIESPTPGVLKGHGWKFNTLKPGDKVVAKVHPLREGRIGGYLVAMSKDGVPIGDGGVNSSTLKDNK